jgi:DNA mismatch repair protein MutL
MQRIHQLSPLVANKIAAGEVIERPASVLKELLENAIDAGSRRIDVDVEQGGTELIRVVDDGAGIVADDLPLAFASHATSKLQDADDLFRIATLGFRGEALASIGAVAQVTLQSRPPDQDVGGEISCRGGNVGAAKPWNGSPGTRVEVRHLFFNTPVRQRFLRAASTEMGHITEAFTRQALAHSRPGPDEPARSRPALHLSLRHNNKIVHDVPSSAVLLDRIARFFGPDVASQLYAVRAQQGPATLYGYIADPSFERGTTRMQYLFLNGRWIRDRGLGHAVQEAYRGLLMTGRYAVAFLFIELPAELVDVNVHPTKAEVRFRDAQAMHHLVFSAVRSRLREANLTARLVVPSTMQPTTPASESWSLSTPAPPAPDLPFASPRHAAPPELARGLPPPPLPPSPPAPPIATAVLQAAPRKVIQLYDAYLVVETQEGMLVIDQHALHERILFEQLKGRLRAGPLETQRLLIPEPVELSAEQAARTLEQREALAELGLGVQEFGGGTLLLTSYPAMLSRLPPQEILKAVVDHLTSQEQLPSREVLFNDLLSLMACHAAVRAGDRLTVEEMDTLIAQRQLADDTHHCPHGRPTALLFSRHDLDRQFRRV